MYINILISQFPVKTADTSGYTVEGLLVLTQYNHLER